jgi:acyl-CoA synthetase (NDP forming)
MLSGVEVMAGAIRDPAFGPLVCFGLGGIHVELLSDVCWRNTPLTDRDADEMIRGIRGFPLLGDYRGRPAVDAAAILQVLLRVARLFDEIPVIRELATRSSSSSQTAVARSSMLESGQRSN